MARYAGRGGVRRVARELMGKKVRFSEILSKRSCGGRREWQRSSTSGVGWVVGWRWLPDGVLDDGNWENPVYLVVDGGQPAILVCTWPSRKPIPIPVDAFVVDHGAEVSSGLEWGDNEIDNSIRRELAVAANSQPRDERGRFLPL